MSESEFAYLAMCARCVSEGVGKDGVGKVIREDGGSSCNGLRRQASRLMEPCSSRKALSIRAARASMLSACVVPNPQHPAVISARRCARQSECRI